MPTRTYSRNGLPPSLQIPSPSESMFTDHDKNDFEDYLQDQDKLVDILPQPFRMVSKVVIEVFEKAWDIINTTEKKRIAEVSRIRPLRYQTTLQLKDRGNATCMCETLNGQFIVFGLPNGLAVLNAYTQSTIDIWLQMDMSVTRLQLSTLKEGIHLICTVDELGQARLFGLAGDKLYCLETIKDVQKAASTSPEKPNIATVCEAAFDGSFIGIVFENPSSGEQHLMVCRTPHTAWITELEGVIAKCDTPNPEEDRSATPSNGGSDLNLSSKTQEERNIKFSSCQTFFRLRPPVAIQPIAFSPLQLGKDNGDVVGHGLNHLVSAHHLEHRQRIFENHHQEQLKNQYGDTTSVIVEPHFHFLTPGRVTTHDMDVTNPTGIPNTVCVWWTRCHNIMHYSLAKAAKDWDPKPDIVWPMASDITASTISPCTSLMAFSLTSGTIIVWDKNLGMVRRVIHLNLQVPIQQIMFICPSACPQAPNKDQPYKKHSNLFLLTMTRDSRMYINECQLGNKLPAKLIAPIIEDENERYIKIRHMPGLPHLIIGCRKDGDVYIINVLWGHVIGQIALPPDYVIANPLNPVIAVGGQGQTIYIKAMHKGKSEVSVNDTDEEPEVDLSLWLLPLNQYNGLNRQRKKRLVSVPYTMHCTADNRAEALFAHRIYQQDERKERLQERWGQIKGDFEAMLARQVTSTVQTKQ